MTDSKSDAKDFLQPEYTKVQNAVEKLETTRRDISRRKSLQETIDDDQKHLKELHEQLESEEDDVESLENITLRSIISRIKGTRLEEIEEEKAEAETLQLEIAVRQSAIQRLLKSAGEVTVEQAHYGLVKAEQFLDNALKALTIKLHVGSSPISKKLHQLETSHASLKALRQEIEEAEVAATQALTALREVLVPLKSAKGWSTYDTFFNGGMISSIIKNNRIDEASQAIATAHRYLLALNAELKDIKNPLSTDVHLPSKALKTMDIWFDNFFSDWMVNDRISASIHSVETTMTKIATVSQTLKNKKTILVEDMEDMDRRRKEILIQLALNNQN